MKSSDWDSYVLGVLMLVATVFALSCLLGRKCRWYSLWPATFLRPLCIILIWEHQYSWLWSLWTSCSLFNGDFDGLCSVLWNSSVSVAWWYPVLSLFLWILDLFAFCLFLLVFKPKEFLPLPLRLQNLTKLYLNSSCF